MNKNMIDSAKTALELLIQQNIRRFPVDMQTLIKQIPNIKLLTYRQAAAQLEMTLEELEWLFPSQDAFTLRAMKNTEKRFLICYQDQVSPARKRFTLAHELAHVLLEHGNEGSTEDAQANCFAQHLLCPRPVLRLLSPDGAPLSQEVLCKTFGLSPTAIRRVLASPSPLPDNDALEIKLYRQLTPVIALADDCGSGDAIDLSVYLNNGVQQGARA